MPVLGEGLVDRPLPALKGVLWVAMIGLSLQLTVFSGGADVIPGVVVPVFNDQLLIASATFLASDDAAWRFRMELLFAVFKVHVVRQADMA